MLPSCPSMLDVNRIRKSQIMPATKSSSKLSAYSPARAEALVRVPANALSPHAEAGASTEAQKSGQISEAQVLAEEHKSAEEQKSAEDEAAFAQYRERRLPEFLITSLLSATDFS